MFLFSRLAAKSPQVLTTLIVFSLASGVLGGVMFYLDSVGPNVLNDLTESVSVDMELSLSSPFYDQNDTSLQDLEELVLEQTGVLDVCSINMIRTESWTEPDYMHHVDTFMGVGQDFFDSFESSITIHTISFDLNRTTCLVQSRILVEEDLEIGDNYTAAVMTFDSYGETLVEYDFVIVGTFDSDLFQEYYYWDQPEESTLRMITTREGLVDAFGALGYGGWSTIVDRIWVDLDEDLFIFAGEEDPVTALTNTRRRIEQSTLPYAWVSWDGFALQDAVSEYSAWSTSMRVLAVSFSLPSIIMGIMLVYFNSKLLADERRRDVGTLKTRGASGWQAFGWILSSAVVTALVGSLGAILTGAFAGILSGSVRTFLEFQLTQLAEFTLLLTPTAMLFVFIFSFGLGFAVALPAAVRALLMSPTEAHQVIEREALLDEEKLGSPAAEIIILGLTGQFLAPLILLVGFLRVGYLGTFFVLTLAPFLSIFIVALSRLLSRPTARIKERVIGRIGKYKFSTGARVISRTAALSKKSEAIGAMFIAMMFTTGFFASIAATTGHNHMVELIMFDVGADVLIEVDPSVTNITLDLVDNITRIEGVQSASGVLTSSAHAIYVSRTYSGWLDPVNRSVSIYAVQPSEWADSAFFLPYFTHTTEPAFALSLLEADPRNVLASFKPVQHYQENAIGQRIPIYSDEIELELMGPEGKNRSEYVIQDVMAQYLPGQGYSQVTYLPGDPANTDFVVLNIDLLHQVMNTTSVNKFYINLDEGTNYTRVMQDIRTLAPNSFSRIESGLQQIDDALDSRAGQTVYGFYTLNVLFQLIYLTVGMVIVASIRVRKMRRQISIMRALGSENTPIIVPILIDTLLSLVIGILIGTLTGWLLASIFSQIPLSFFGTVNVYTWGRLPVIMIYPLHLMLGIIAVSLLTSLGTSYWISSRNLKRNIAEEIQYAE